jgi:hypothetical protein
MIVCSKSSAASICCLSSVIALHCLQLRGVESASSKRYGSRFPNLTHIQGSPRLDDLHLLTKFTQLRSIQLEGAEALSSQRKQRRYVPSVVARNSICTCFDWPVLQLGTNFGSSSIQIPNAGDVLLNSSANLGPIKLSQMDTADNVSQMIIRHGYCTDSRRSCDTGYEYGQESERSPLSLYPRSVSINFDGE